MTQQIAYSSYRERERERERTRLWSVVLVWCQRLYKAETLGWLSHSTTGGPRRLSSGELLPYMRIICGILPDVGAPGRAAHPSHTNLPCAQQLRSFSFMATKGGRLNSGEWIFAGIYTLKPDVREEMRRGGILFYFQTDCATLLTVWRG